MRHITAFSSLVIALLWIGPSLAGDAPLRPGEQLPGQMHTAMAEQPQITVGQADADLIGSDNRALQAAVDYIAALGGGDRRDRSGPVRDA